MRPIFVRELSKTERTELERLLKSTNTGLYKRARVIWLSATQHLKAPQIAKMVNLHLINVRLWIKRFNRQGIDSLKQKFSPGRPKEIKPQQRKALIKLLKTKPKEFGLSFSSWSLRGLCEIAVKEKIVKTISPEYMRRIIIQEGYSYKRSKQWISSPDPEYEVKKTSLRRPLGIWTRLAR